MSPYDSGPSPAFSTPNRSPPSHFCFFFCAGFHRSFISLPLLSHSPPFPPAAVKRGQRAACDLQVTFHAFLHAGRGRGAPRWWRGSNDAWLLAVLCGWFGVGQGREGGRDNDDYDDDDDHHYIYSLSVYVRRAMMVRWPCCPSLLYRVRGASQACVDVCTME